LLPIQHCSSFRQPAGKSFVGIEGITRSELPSRDIVSSWSRFIAAGKPCLCLKGRTIAADHPVPEESQVSSHPMQGFAQLAVTVGSAGTASRFDGDEVTR